MPPNTSPFAAAPAMTLLPVDDLPRAVRFYTETLGLPVEMYSDLPGHAFVRLAGGHRVDLFLDGRTAVPHATLTFAVDDVPAVVGELEGQGVAVERRELWATPPGATLGGRENVEGPGPTAACFTDTEGNGLCVHEGLP